VGDLCLTPDSLNRHVFVCGATGLPGYGFSDRCLDRWPARLWIADLFHLVMAEQLGYERCVAHGDDVGGGVINRLGLRNPPWPGSWGSDCRVARVYWLPGDHS
jgi:hypothetical protein